MKTITVYDIAKEANVSVTTVSRVLNDTAPVKASTRQKVMEVINKYQFQPNAQARSLIKKETNMIGVILPDITNPFFPAVFWGIENEARKKGYSIILCDTAGQFDRESEYISLLREKRVDGVIYMGGRVNLARCSRKLMQEVMDLAAASPVVIINGNLAGSNLHRVIADEAEGAALATQHLLDLGHRKLAFIGGSADTATTQTKVKAFKKKLAERGVRLNPNWLLHDTFSIQSGRELMARLLAGGEWPTGVVCVNDFTAIGAIKAAIEHGLRIPDDLSIVGFDDSPLATAIIPELTSVSQESHMLGETSIQVLNQILQGQKSKKLMTLTPQLVVRQSTGPAR